MQEKFFAEDFNSAVMLDAILYNPIPGCKPYTPSPGTATQKEFFRTASFTINLMLLFCKSPILQIDFGLVGFLISKTNNPLSVPHNKNPDESMQRQFAFSSPSKRGV